MSKHLEDNNLIARWMDDRLSDEEKEQLKASGELDALKTVIDDIDTWKVKPFNVDAGLSRLKEANATVVPIKKSTNKNYLGIAAGLAILFTCSIVWYFISTGATIITTEIAENKTIDLPLGSQVAIDAGSSITYNENKWEESRLVTLKGQAYFKVTSGSPFVVNTPTAQVSVLGTQFNINTQHDQFKVSCYEGKIKVSYQENDKIITMGQSVTLHNGELQVTTHQLSRPDWMSGISNYEKTPLKNVIADVKRYYNVEIDLPKAYESLQFTGTIEHKDLQHTLTTIFTTMEIEYRIKDRNKVIFE